MVHRSSIAMLAMAVWTWPCPAPADENDDRDVAARHDRVAWRANSAAAERRVLDERLAALEARLDVLTRDQRHGWLTDERARRVRSLIADVLADADSRSILLPERPTAGWSERLFLRDADGDFALELEGRLQSRFVFNHRTEPDSTLSAFEIRRAQLLVEGHVADPSWRYRIQNGYTAESGDFALLDAWISKDLGRGWEATVGQFRAPFLRESLMSSTRQLAVERSLVDRRFGQGRTQGVLLDWSGSRFRLSASYNDGFKEANTSALESDTRYAFGGRVEVLGAGPWSAFHDFTSFNDDEPGWMMGFAAHYQEADAGSSNSDPDDTFFTWTVDASIELGGGNLFGYVTGRRVDEGDLVQWGAVLQGGVFIVPEEWEIFARYEHGDDDGVSPTDLSVLTLGINGYVRRHRLKWTTDIGYGFEAIGSAWASDGAGWRDDPDNDDGQIVIRSQLQVIY